MPSTARPRSTRIEAVKQAAVADRIVLTKTDLADAARRDAASRARLRALNPAAPILDAAKGEATAEQPARLRPLRSGRARSPT